MIKDGDQVAGAPLLGAVKVMGSGSGRALAGGLAKAAFGGRRDCPLLPRQLAVLAVTSDDFVLLNFKHGAIHPKATGVLARIPRHEVVAAEVPRAVGLNRMSVRFSDDTEWHFEVTKPNAGKARTIAGLLTA